MNGLVLHESTFRARVDAGPLGGRRGARGGVALRPRAPDRAGRPAPERVLRTLRAASVRRSSLLAIRASSPGGMRSSPEPAPPELARYRAEVRGARRAPAVLAPTARAMLRRLERHRGPLPERRRQVIANGRRTPAALPIRATRRRRSSRALAAGRLWDRAKNIERAQRWRRRTFPARYGSPVAACSPTGARRDSRNGGELLGCARHPRRSAGHRRRAIFAHPARYEPFGLARSWKRRSPGAPWCLGDIPSLREVLGTTRPSSWIPNDDEGPPLARSERSSVDARRAARVRPRARAKRALGFTPAADERGPGDYLRPSTASVTRLGNGGRAPREEGERALRIGACSATPCSSDWNHGNAHFLRGVVTELAERGHEVRAYEDRGTPGASRTSFADHGAAASRCARRAEVSSVRVDPLTVRP